MKITFDYQQEYSRIFGTIYRPVAEVRIIVNDINIRERFYVDSGADITLIPKSMGEVFGFTVDKVQEMSGVGGTIPTVIKDVVLTIGDKKFDAKIAWALIENIPPLLGRKDVFDNFRVTFNEAKKVVEFTY